MEDDLGQSPQEIVLPFLRTPPVPKFPLAAAAPVIAGAGLLTAYGVSRKK